MAARAVFALGWLLPMAAHLGCGGPPEAREPQRIVALAPNVVEELFALGLGDRVVGVGDYSRWPPEVAELPRIGSLFDARLEQITALQPELAVLLPSEEELRDQLERLGVEVLTVRSETLQDVEDAFLAIAEHCGVPEQGEQLVAEWRRELAPALLSRALRVVISVGRQTGDLAGIVVAGPGTYLDELLNRLGVVNAFADSPLLYPQVGLDEIVRRWPDAVIELQPSPGNFEALKNDWSVLPDLPAVERGCVRVIAGDHVLIPGPRLSRLYNEMRQALSACATAS